MAWEQDHNKVLIAYFFDGDHNNISISKLLATATRPAAIKASILI